MDFDFVYIWMCISAFAGRDQMEIGYPTNDHADILGTYQGDVMGIYLHV